MLNKPKIVIADSQFLVIESLVHIIESENKYILCSIANNRYSLLKQLKVNSPDLLITDFNLIDYDGSEDLKSIMKDFKDISILILTNKLTHEELGKLLKSGIKNISLKTDVKSDLLSAIELAIKKKKRFSDQVLDMILEINGRKDSSTEPSGLTPSEIEIIKLIADGNTTKEIARKKNISDHTVMAHRKNIFRKLNINNASELVMFAVRKGLIDNIEYYI